VHTHYLQKKPNIEEKKANQFFSRQLPLKKDKLKFVKFRVKKADLNLPTMSQVLCTSCVNVRILGQFHKSTG